MAGLIVVVAGAAGAGSGLAGTLGAAGESSVGPVAAFVVVALVAGAAALAAVALLSGVRPGFVREEQREPRVPPPRPPTTALERLAIAALAMAIVAGVLAAAVPVAGRSGTRPQPGGSESPARIERAAPSHADHSSAQGTAGAWVAAGIALVVVATAAGLLLRGRRAGVGSFASETAEPRRALRGPAGEALAGMQPVRDDREAVIAAYAALERRLAADGLGRRPPEGPVEYLERLLAAAAGPSRELRRLSELFRLARFSRHEIGLPERLEAEAALQALASEGGS